MPQTHLNHCRRQHTPHTGRAQRETCEESLQGTGVRPGGSPHYGVGAAFVVVERVVVDRVPTAVEVMWEVDEGGAAIEKCGQVFELLHHDSCRRGTGRLSPTRPHSPAREKSGY